MLICKDETYYEDNYYRIRDIVLNNKIDILEYDKEMPLLDKIQFLYENILKYYKTMIGESVCSEDEDSLRNQLLIEYLESYILYLISQNKEFATENTDSLDRIRESFRGMLKDESMKAYVISSLLNCYFFLGESFYEIDISNKKDVEEIAIRYQRCLNGIEDAEITNSEKEFLFKYLIFHMEDKDLADIRDYFIIFFIHNIEVAKRMSKGEREFFINYMAYIKCKRLLIPVPKIYMVKKDVKLQQLNVSAFCNINYDGSSYIIFSTDVLNNLLPLLTNPVVGGQVNRRKNLSLINIVFHEVEHSLQGYDTVNNETNENSYAMVVHRLLSIEKNNSFDNYMANHNAYLLEIKADLMAVLETKQFLIELGMEDYVKEYNLDLELYSIKRSLIVLRAKINKEQEIPYIAYEIGNVSKLLSDKFKDNDTIKYDKYDVLKRVFNVDGSLKSFDEIVLQYSNASLEEKKIYYNVLDYYLIYHSTYGEMFKSTKIDDQFLDKIDLGKASLDKIRAFYDVFSYHIRKIFKEIQILVMPNLFSEYSNDIIEELQLRFNCLHKETAFIKNNKEYFDRCGLDVTTILQYYDILLRRFKYLIESRRKEKSLLGYDRMIEVMDNILGSDDEQMVKKMVM